MERGEEDLPCGVYRRRKTGRLYFEMRTGEGKLYSTKIKSVEEGALCHDIARRYWELATRTGAPGGKRKAPLEHNYPEYSASLVLEDLPVDFNVGDNKERAMEVILKQARAAVKGLPTRAQAAAKSRSKVQKHSVQDVGSQSIDNRSSSQQNAFNSSRASKEHPDLAGVYRGNDVQKFLKDICEHIKQCDSEYNLKVIERGELERKVKDIKEDSGIISFRKSVPDKFHEHMACFKQLVGSDGKLSPLLEAREQEYLSEESKCCELRKKLEDHNLESIPGSLMGDGNKMTGRRRADENERLPPVQPHWTDVFLNMDQD